MFRINTTLFSLTFVIMSLCAVSQETRYSDSWGSPWLTLLNENNTGVRINYSLPGFTMEDMNLDG